MKFIKYGGTSETLEKGAIYQVARRTLKGEYVLKESDERVPKEECVPVKVHEGTVIYMPKVGESMTCACYEKGQKIEYQTSAVVKIVQKAEKQFVVYTQNSVYIVFVILL